MPLPSVRLYGARQCKAISRRSKSRCLNPAAYKCSTCRYHGATPPHSRRNVKGEIHPQYINGFYTKEAKAERSAKNLMFRYLTDLGNHYSMFYKKLKTRGRPPSGYTQLDLTDSEQLAIAIIKTLPSK